MAKEQNQNPVSEKPAEAKPFRKLSEFSVDEIMALPRVQLKVQHVHNEQYHSDRYNAFAYFLDNELEIRFQIDRATFFLIARLRGKDVHEGESYLVSFPYRMVKGRAVSESDGHEFDYYYCEGYACPREKKVYLSSVLRGSQIDLLVVGKLEGIVDRGFAGKTGEVAYFDDLG